MKRILYIEDDKEIGSWVYEDLQKRGYLVTWLTSGEDTFKFIDCIDLAILDIMLPGLDGFTIGNRLKTEDQNTPILLLSARTAIEDKLHGLEFADDYLTKPFHPDELAARIDVLLRRYHKNVKQMIPIQHLNIYHHENRIVDTRSGQEIILTGKQYRILLYFIENANQILTKEQIYEAVWGDPYFDGDKSLMVHIRHLREKIENDPSHPTIIETIRGIGYRIKS